MMKKFKLFLGLALATGVAYAATNRVWESQEWVSGQITTPSNPSSGKNKFYFKSDDKLYKLDSAGNETVVGGGAADQVTFASYGNISATDVQAALEELDDEKALASDLSNHIGDTSGAHAASAISNIGAGNISSTDVQAAINELDTEKQPVDSDLTALAGNSSDGLWTHTGSGTGSARTITGTANQITVTNGNGVSGNPTLSIPSDPITPGTDLTFGTSSGINLKSGTAVPTTTATTGNVGSLYFNTSTGDIYRKTDSGSSTNWALMGTSAAITAPTSWTPTFANFGTVTSINAKYWQVGNGIAFEATWTAGTVVNATASMTLPSVCTTASDYPTLQVVGVLTRSASNLAASDYVLAESSSGFLYFGLQHASGSGLNKNTGTAYSNNTVLSAKGYVRCAGLASVVNTASTPIITGYTSYTPTFTGFGSVTCSNCFKYRQVGNAIEIEGTWVNGTTTATEAQITLPTVCTSASDYATIQKVGDYWSGITSSGSNSNSVLIEPSKSYMTFSNWNTTTFGKVNGNAHTSSATLSLKATIRCAGLPGVIPAPSLVGFNTNNGSSAIRTEAAIIAAPSGGACTVTEIGNSDWINGNATSSGTGLCAVTFNAGIFTAAPACTCTVAGNTARECQVSTQATTSGATFQVDAAATPSNQIINVICIGAR